MYDMPEYFIHIIVTSYKQYIKNIYYNRNSNKTNNIIELCGVQFKNYNFSQQVTHIFLEHARQIGFSHFMHL